MTAPDSPRRIHIAAALLVRDDGMTLVVRKRGTTAFMQPGGKLEPGEAPEAALRRELGEELHIVGSLGEPMRIGQFSAPAANEAGAVVVADLFRMDFAGDVTPQAEIEEIRWIDPAAPGSIQLAPLTRDEALPALLRSRNRAGSASIAPASDRGGTGVTARLPRRR
jgi:8-oxo-dGTP pyrophosphatase MutT (NUDIX family)